MAQQLSGLRCLDYERQQRELVWCGERRQDMTVEQAIQIVAKQLVSNAAREIQWEESPDIG